MDFKNILGHERTIDKLKETIKKDKVAHGYIIDGPIGSGKKSIGKAFAKGILCSSFSGDCCNVCSSCLKIESDNHPDLIYIYPDGKSIKNHQIESLQQEIIRKPYESEKKIFIINDADSMTGSAQNRLLKTLEEPPAYAVIIMLSTNSNRFLPTILSRIQLLKLNRIHSNLIEKFISKKYDIHGNEAKIYAKLSNGIVGRAIELKESEDFNIKREETIDILEKLICKDPLKFFDGIDFFSKYKDSVEEILDMMLYWFRDLILIKETDCNDFLINIDKVSQLQEHRYKLESSSLVEIIEKIEESKKDLRAHVNYQLTIENMLLCIQEVQ
ncbi:MAG: AAA family ATPase [Anaeromicrobium sp.]|jgi:DNA polymerase-3 subunit delta'|uniref:DNA polymerase III subunit n=1 Tax=Anaeromicrobium sp. TaxID=1929132 RepID=UPI0025ECC33D|nr:DNA polymerase III subunit delta' C-terminal domain-containing protein [Anaeromicrobium sp.]MCT4593656.1 AAA family ATPase [Anaeromicrobium sp.]